jgi:hypothetical protein
MVNKEIREFDEEERQRAKEKEKSNKSEEPPEWPDNPVDGHAI